MSDKETIIEIPLDIIKSEDLSFTNSEKIKSLLDKLPLTDDQKKEIIALAKEGLDKNKDPLTP